MFVECPYLIEVPKDLRPLRRGVLEPEPAMPLLNNDFGALVDVNEPAEVTAEDAECIVNSRYVSSDYNLADLNVNDNDWPIRADGSCARRNCPVYEDWVSALWSAVRSPIILAFQAGRKRYIRLSAVVF